MGSVQPDDKVAANENCLQLICRSAVAENTNVAYHTECAAVMAHTLRSGGGTDYKRPLALLWLIWTSLNPVCDKEVTQWTLVYSSMR